MDQVTLLSSSARHARVVEQDDGGSIGEKVLFLGVGAVGAVIGYGLLLVFTRAGLRSGPAETLQLVVTLQLSFLGNDRLTYRRRIAGAPGRWTGRWARYLAGRTSVSVLTLAAFVPLDAALGHHLAYWVATAAGTAGNYVADRTFSHRGNGSAAGARLLAAHPRLRAVLVMALVVATVLFVCYRYPDPVLGATSASMIAVALTTLAFQLYAWRTPESCGQDEQVVPTWPRLRIAIFLPARKEAAVLGATLERMVCLRHPDYVVCVIVDHRDDADTLAIAREYQARYPRLVRVIAYPSVSRSSKPIGLNEAMRALEASGEHWDVVGVADAEDRFHIDLLTTIDHIFRDKRPGIVQGAVQLVNYSVRSTGHHLPQGYVVALADRLGIARSARLARLDRTGPLRRRIQHAASGWWRAANCLEYYKWFSSRLKMQASIRVMPLGGNTVFFSHDFMDAVREHTGTWWDEECLTEDCKIGIVASVLDFGVEVFSHPEMATLEETPTSLAKFVRQRVRWMQGFIQVFGEKEWHRLPTLRQRLMAVYVLGFQFFQAATGILAPISLTYALVRKAPAPLVLLSIVPLIISLWNVVIDLLMFHDFVGAYASPRKRRAHPLDYLGIALGSYAFQLVLSIAAVGAIYRSLAGVTNWVKTDHSGAHFAVDLTEPAPVGVR